MKIYFNNIIYYLNDIFIVKLSTLIIIKGSLYEIWYVWFFFASLGRMIYFAFFFGVVRHRENFKMILAFLKQSFISSF